MKLVSYRAAMGLQLGILADTGIIDVEKTSQKLFGNSQLADPNQVYQMGLEALPHLQQIKASAEDFLPQIETFAPCIPNPQKIICVGLNYRSHADEANMTYLSSPILFSKFANALAAHHESIPIPQEVEKADYEAELVVVIGKQARYVSEKDALDYVFGYCIGNDVSARDLQMRTSQWMLGKTPDKFMPIGPYLVTTDEIANPQDLNINLWLNGDLRQSANTKDMIFSVAQLISYISRYMTLEPGDLISTGTPEGVILGREEKIWLKPEDELIVEIDGLGQLVNKMQAEA